MFKVNPINSGSDIYLTIPKSTHPSRNKKPHECGAEESILREL